MSGTVRLSSDFLLDAAKQHYDRTGWTVLDKNPPDLEALVGKLARRPEFVAVYDGMEHLVFVSGRVSNTVLSTQKQVLFDVDNSGRCSHIVLVCENPIAPKKEATSSEKACKEMGLGLLVVRPEGDPYYLLMPKLRGFKGQFIAEAVPPRLRVKVADALRRISEGDVCVAIMDLVQIVELELDRIVPAAKNKPFGAKLKEAEKNGNLSQQSLKAARRINVPRIKRAHPKSHKERRKFIVLQAQSIVNDCLALLTTL